MVPFDCRILLSLFDIRLPKNLSRMSVVRSLMDEFRPLLITRDKRYLLHDIGHFLVWVSEALGNSLRSAILWPTALSRLEKSCSCFTSN